MNAVSNIGSLHDVRREAVVVRGGQRAAVEAQDRVVQTDDVHVRGQQGLDGDGTADVQLIRGRGQTKTDIHLVRRRIDRPTAADRQRSAVDEGVAGVGVRAVERQRAGVRLGHGRGARNRGTGDYVVISRHVHQQLGRAHRSEVGHQNGAGDGGAVIQHHRGIVRIKHVRHPGRRGILPVHRRKIPVATAHRPINRKRRGIAGRHDQINRCVSHVVRERGDHAGRQRKGRRGEGAAKAAVFDQRKLAHHDGRDGAHREVDVGQGEIARHGQRGRGAERAGG